ncbi:MAG TPA: VOC family protein [Solirubrobacteraceae bacterium]|nr:VOC family protein [Solirubrobacteraceae bacterium]
MEAIPHLDLAVTSLERSLAFYRGLLRPLGYVEESAIEGERGERVAYLNHVASGGGTGLREAQSDAHGVPYNRYGVGVHHVAFTATSRAMVDERAAWLLEQGAEIESEPRDYDYSPGYYAVFFRDPDGIKLEIVHTPQDPDLAAAVGALAARLAALETRLT